MLVVRSAVVGPFQESTWLLADDADGEALLVDPGGEVDRLLALREPGGFRIAAVFLTHGHIDHVAGCAEVVSRLDRPCPVSLHRGDAAWLEALPQQAAMFGLGPCTKPTVDRYHEDGESLSVGSHRARVIHTPGHSVGSCCLFFEDDRLLVAGDTLFAGSVGRADLPGGDFDLLEQSIKQRIFPLGDDVRFLPGHGPEGTVGRERRHNPFVGERAVGRFV